MCNIYGVFPLNDLHGIGTAHTLPFEITQMQKFETVFKIIIFLLQYY